MTTHSSHIRLTQVAFEFDTQQHSTSPPSHTATNIQASGSQGSKNIEIYTMPFDDYPKVADWRSSKADGNVDDISIDQAWRYHHKILNKEIECFR